MWGEIKIDEKYFFFYSKALLLNLLHCNRISFRKLVYKSTSLCFKFLFKGQNGIFFDFTSDATNFHRGRISCWGADGKENEMWEKNFFLRSFVVIRGGFEGEERVKDKSEFIYNLRYFLRRYSFSKLYM